jgi:hypothetical protein
MSGESFDISRGVIDAQGNHPELHKGLTENRLNFQPFPSCEVTLIVLAGMSVG